MSGEIRSYRDLVAWQLAMQACRSIYHLTGSFPESEKFGLVHQLRRAAVSVPSNIADGWGRGSTADYQRFLRVSRGSLYEVETQLLLAMELGFAETSSGASVLEEVEHAGRVLSGLLRSIEGKSGGPSG